MKSLNTVVQTTQETLLLWNAQVKNDLIDIANSREVIALTRALIAQNADHQDLRKSPSQKQLRQLMADKLKKQTTNGFFVIAQDRTSIGSMRDGNIGSENIIHRYRKQSLDRVFSGENLFIPTIVSDVPLKTHSGKLRKGQPTIFVAAPIKDDSGVIAVLTLRLDPANNFTRISQLGRIGETGETYAFDEQGTLLTQSRFEQQLRRLEENYNGDQSQGLIRLTDPGGNMFDGFTPTQPMRQRPLTFMAQSALAGRTFAYFDSYRDYRGVEVFGAWRWDNTLNIGIATEIDVDEAMRPYYETRTTLIWLLSLTVLFSFALLLTLLRQEKRAQQVLTKAHGELERKVELRTKELKESAIKFRTIFESSADALIILNETGFIDCNQATLEMFKCDSRKSFLGTHPAKWSAITQQCDVTCTRKAMLRHLALALKRGQHAFEWNFTRADDEIFPCEVLFTALLVKDKRTIQGTIRDISKRKQAEQELALLHGELQQLSYLDSLTGIANRRMFDQTFANEWSRCQRNKRPVSLMMIDIDYFKQFNDLYGHQKGDDCLISVAKALNSVSKRASDLVARYGGEEFIILLPETPSKEANRLAKTYLKKITELQIPHPLSQVCDVVSVSIGVCTSIASLNIKPALLISNADRLLYKAKHNGRNRIEHTCDGNTDTVYDVTLQEVIRSHKES